jgi:hypothetical protein
MVAHSAPDWAVAATARLRKDALGTTPSPPAAQERSVVEGEPAPPQGGDGVASQGAEEAPREPEEATQADAEAEPEPHATYEMHDIGIDEMWKPEHKGKWGP